MKFKEEMLLPVAEPFTNAYTSKELIDRLDTLVHAGRSLHFSKR